MHFTELGDANPVCSLQAKKYRQCCEEQFPACNAALRRVRAINSTLSGSTGCLALLQVAPAACCAAKLSAKHLPSGGWACLFTRKAGGCASRIM